MTTTIALQPVQDVTHSHAASYVAATNMVASRFFHAYADAIALACRDMAVQFQDGGRLFVVGDGAQRSDAAHVVVEFLHPVVVGKRALPAMSLPDIESGDAVRSLATLARDADVLMVLSAGALSEASLALLQAARAHGLLPLALIGARASADVAADHVFAVESRDACIVQETHELLYHVLWELVHVFFAHRAAGT